MVRDRIFPVLLALGLISFTLFLVDSRKRFKSQIAQIGVFGIFLIAILLMPLFSAYQPKSLLSGDVSQQIKEKNQKFRQKQIEKGVPKLVRYLNSIRRGINSQIEVEDGSSATDRNVVFESWIDVVFYSPKAIVTGLFSPFPNMWFENGKTFGRTGRIIAALEVSVIYILSIFAFLNVYYERKNLGLWLVGLTILIGCGALGLVITNVGTLYRMRFAFWFLLIILGINGITRLVKSRQVSS